MVFLVFRPFFTGSSDQTGRKSRSSRARAGEGQPCGNSPDFALETGAWLGRNAGFNLLCPRPLTCPSFHGPTAASTVQNRPCAVKRNFDRPSLIALRWVAVQRPERCRPTLPQHSTPRRIRQLTRRVEDCLLAGV